MSAPLLREAARLMRERATTAPLPPGPWETEFSDVIRTDVPFGNPGYLIAECSTITEARHIASWHPAVALAVADWLGAVADYYEPIWTGPHVPPEMARALAVARTYLGRDA